MSEITFDALQKYISKPQQKVPLLVLHKGKFAGNNIYPCIEFTDEKGLSDLSPSYNNNDYTTIDFEQYNFATRSFKITDKLSANAITDWIYEVASDPIGTHILQHRFEQSEIQNIIESASLNHITLMKVTKKRKYSDNLSDIKWFRVTLKRRTKKDKETGKSVYRGPKIHAEMMIPDHEYAKYPFSQKLHCQNWCMQFADLIGSFKWKWVNDTALGYYYCVHHRNKKEFSMSISNFKLSDERRAISFKDRKSYEYVPGIYYDPSMKPIQYIDQFNARTNNIYATGFCPIAKRISMEVMSWQMANQIKYEYVTWIRSGTGTHFFSPNVLDDINFWRAKSFVHYQYWWESDAFKKARARFQALQIEQRLADTNVGAGLRYIGDDIPPFLLKILEFIKAIGRIPKNMKYDQYSFVMYQCNPSRKTSKMHSFSSLGSHSECDKFVHLDQISLGCDSVLSFDKIGGAVNGNAGLSLKGQSFAEYDMNNYWMGASDVLKDKGGKHEMCRRHLRLGPNQWRLAILLRVCKPTAKAEADVHAEECDNCDEYCYCLNPSLPRRRKRKRSRKNTMQPPAKKRKLNK